VQCICKILIQTLKETLKGLTGNRKSKDRLNNGKKGQNDTGMLTQCWHACSGMLTQCWHACSLYYLEIKDTIHK
jgi:hypothetical protein